jgi:hypothetical protein
LSGLPEAQWNRGGAVRILLYVDEQCSWIANTSSAPALGGSSRWRNDMVKPAKNTICLWYDRDAEEAARFYAKTFPDSSVGAVHRAPGDIT